ncbi:MAG: hypothetical protein HQM11_20310, partial [SAR324 cluster bacterium]|nr:hypothetical protein [SAR324 cluster bacterium]
LNHFLCREVESDTDKGIYPYEWLIHDFFWGEPEQKDLIDFIYRNMAEFPISPHIQHTPLGRLNVWWTYVHDSQGNQRKCALAMWDTSCDEVLPPLRTHKTYYDVSPQFLSAFPKTAKGTPYIAWNMELALSKGYSQGPFRDRKSKSMSSWNRERIIHP